MRSTWPSESSSGVSVASTASAYAGRHVASGLMALVGVGAVVMIIRLTVRSWPWALFAGAVLGSLPLWVGHGMFNIKDTPVASGYTLATAGIVALATLSNAPSRRTRLGIAWVAIIAGTVLAAGTRAASGVAIAAGVVALVIAMLVAPRPAEADAAWSRWRPSMRVLLHGTGAMVASYVILLLIYPNVYRNPVLLAYEALYVSAKFPFPETVMTNGEWMTQPVSWSYLPLWFGAQMPLLVLAGSLVFVAWWVMKAVVSYRGRQSAVAGALVLASVPVLVQAFALPLGAALAQSNIYNGTRQFMFVVPALAVLATYGVIVVARAVGPDAKRRVLRSAMWSAVALGVVAPLVAQLFLFPYSYAYYNLPTSIAGVDGRWPTDYWRQSARELTQRLPLEGVESCAYEQYRKDELFSCLQESPFRPYVGERGEQAAVVPDDPTKYWYLRENQGWVDLPAGCEPFDAITRPLYFSTITIAQIARCDLSQLGSDLQLSRGVATDGGAEPVIRVGV